MKFDYIIEFNNLEFNGNDPIEFQESQLAMQIINVFTTILTLIGFLGVVFVYCMFKELKQFAYRLVIYMCFYDVMMNIGNFFFSNTSDQNWCIA